MTSENSILMGDWGGISNYEREYTKKNQVTLWLFDIAMENEPFLKGKSSNNIHKLAIFHGYVK